MSSNLLAEFDTFYGSSQHDNVPQTAQNKTFTEPLNSHETNPWAETLAANQSTVLDGALDLQNFPDEEENEWGEFESGRNEGQDRQQLDFDDFNVWEEDSQSATHYGATYTNAMASHGVIESSSDRIPEPKFVSHVPIEISGQVEVAPPSRSRRESNVLFDVEDELFEDEFGEFETAEQIATPTFETKGQNATGKPNSSTLLIDFESEFDSPSNSSKQKPSHARQNQSYLDFFGDLPSRHIHDESSQMPESLLRNEAWSREPQMEDAWDFEPSPSEQTEHGLTPDKIQISQLDIEAEQFSGDLDARNSTSLDGNFGFGEKSSIENQTPQGDDANDWDDFDTAEQLEQPSNPGDPAMLRETLPNPSEVNKLPTLLQSLEEHTSLPPSNIPPPTFLLPLFPPIFKDGLVDIQKALAIQKDDNIEKDLQPSSESIKVCIDSYLSISTVLAHVIAGRKLRWKRDALLAQSMSIGPASSGKGSGMKLVGVDKGEAAKEDRETADVVKSWKTQLGRLRAVVAEAGVTKGIPDIAETLPVRLAPPGEGAMSAPKPCALCGLKRNERVPKVDIEVHDDFGEYWHEHWGHKSCVEFWYTFRSKLASR